MRAAFLRPWLAGRLAAVAPPAAFAVAVEDEKEDGRARPAAAEDADTVVEAARTGDVLARFRRSFPPFGGFRSYALYNCPNGAY